MTAYTVLKSLLLPPGLLILILLAALVLARGVPARLLLVLALALLIPMSLPAVAIRLMAPLEPYPALGTAIAPIPDSAQAIVVLGAGRQRGAPEYGGDTLDARGLRRVRYAALLQRRTGLPLYVTGGNPPGEEGTPVGQIMARVLRDDYGVPVAGVESASRTTWENAGFTAPLLEQAGISHLLLVSDAWHLARGVEAFRATGLRVTPAPTGFVHYSGWEQALRWSDWLPSARALLISQTAIHEHLGRVWYQLRLWTGGPPPASQGASRSMRQPPSP